MSVYRVVKLGYRGHAPGQTFVATLDPEVEKRALRRGNIVLLQEGPVTLDTSKIRRPKG